jgi:hypothetical protein
MAKLVNWDWDKYAKNDDIEDMFLSPKNANEPPIEENEIVTRDDLLKLSIESDLQACKDAFDFTK